jgi:hypothetical protein
MMANCPNEETSANGGNFAAHDVFATYGKWGPKPDAEGRKVHQDGLAGEVKIRQSASLREISDSIASSMPALASGCYRDIRCVASVSAHHRQGQVLERRRDSRRRRRARRVVLASAR